MNKWFRVLLTLFAVLCAACVAGCARTQPVTLRYAAWNLGDGKADNLERSMVAAFNAKHPNIQVVIDEQYAKGYDAMFRKQAEEGALPDIFMYANIPAAYESGWCADLTEQASRDAEWSGIPGVLREAASVKGRVAAIPSAYYFFGYFYNASLFASKGMAAPMPGYTLEDFTRTVAMMTDIPGRSVGLADEGSIIDWYPAAAASRFGWYSWDGGKFNLDSPEFIAGVKLTRALCAAGQVYSRLPDTDKAALGASNDWEAWNAGLVAMKFDGTWAAGDYAKLGFEVRFAGLPGGRVCIVPDFLFISKDSAHPAEAYEFAKFMSAYSAEGFAERMKIAGETGLAVTTAPMVRNRGLIDAYFKKAALPGMREVYDAISESSFVEGAKVLPGFGQARWSYETGIAVGDKQNATIGDVLTDAYLGGTDIDSVAARLNSAANACIEIFPRPADN